MKRNGEDFMSRYKLLMLMSALMLPAAGAYAEPTTFTANLTQALEVPPTGSVAAGVNAGGATTVPAFSGFPLGVTSGTYDHVLDLTSASSYNPAFVTMQG